jgi:hypothetical protein
MRANQPDTFVHSPSTCAAANDRNRERAVASSRGTTDAERSRAARAMMLAPFPCLEDSLMMIRARTTLAILALLLGACGPSAPAPTPDSGPIVRSDGGPDDDDPLFDTWFAQITVGDNQTQTLTFNSDRTFMAIHSQVNSSKSAERAGCVEQVTDVGTFLMGMAAGSPAFTTMVDGAQSGRYVYTGCDVSTDNGTRTGMAFFPSAQWTYTISGNTLTLHDSAGDVEFVRQ